MIDSPLPERISNQMIQNELIKKSLESIIWFGSIKNNQDVHTRSDFDFQVVLNKPTVKLTLAINKILEQYPAIDLSIMYLQDIYNDYGKLIFHDGTKSLFFMYVLAAGEVLYGRDIYTEAIKNISLEDVKPSLLVTIREYLSRLRVMAIKDVDDTLAFQKYSLKLFKDVLVYVGDKKPESMSRITNSVASKRITSLYNFSAASQVALEHITDYTKNMSREEMAYLLFDYEHIVKELCNE